MRITSRATTHVGNVRSLNEDAFLDNGERGTWAVADGMGGHAAGDMASKAVIDSLSDLVVTDDFDTSLEQLQARIAEVNADLVEDSSSMREERKPGSTLVALLIHGQRGAVVWAGDSRVYQARDNRLRRLTRDHSHVQNLVDQGLIVPEDAERHPMANVITRAVGIRVPLVPDTEVFEVRVGDRYLLCSDGLTRVVDDEEIGAMLDGAPPEQVISGLLEKALDRGAPDNVTLVIVDCLED